MTFSIPELVNVVQTQLMQDNAETQAYWGSVQMWVFLALSAGFAVKVPLMPFHTWLPLAHVEAPTAGSVDLAGVLLKLGAYGFLRLCIPLCPDVSVWLGVPLITWAAALGIVYGALCCLRPGRRQETDRLQLGEPSRPVHARHVQPQQGRHPGQHLSDVQSRPVYLGAVPPHRHDLRAVSHAQAVGLQRHGRANALVCRPARLFRPVQRRATRPERVHRRIPVPERHLRVRTAVLASHAAHGDRRQRHDPRRLVPDDDATQTALRPGEGAGPRGARRQGPQRRANGACWRPLACCAWCWASFPIRS